MFTAITSFIWDILIRSSSDYDNMKTFHNKLYMWNWLATVLSTILQIFLKAAYHTFKQGLVGFIFYVGHFHGISLAFKRTKIFLVRNCNKTCDEVVLVFECFTVWIEMSSMNYFLCNLDDMKKSRKKQWCSVKVFQSIVICFK